MTQAPNPFAAPDATPLDPAVENVGPVWVAGYQLADRSERFWAAFLDMAALFLGTAFLVFITWEGTAPKSSLPYVLFCWLLLNGWGSCQSGQSMGKKILDIAVVRSDGRRGGFWLLFGLRFGLWALICYVPFSVGFVRFTTHGIYVTLPLLGLLWSLVDVLFLFRSDRRCLHDWIAGTMVVKLSPTEQIAPASAEPVVAVAEDVVGEPAPGDTATACDGESVPVVGDAAKSPLRI